MKKNLITVFDGVNSLQGNAIVNYLLNDDRFHIRALTNRIDKDSIESAEKLIEKGCQVVKCDPNDTIEEIEKALHSSYAVFLNTDIFIHNIKEASNGKKAVEAAYNAGVRHLIFSGFVPARKISNNSFPVEHFDLKYEIEEYAREVSIIHPEFITSFIYAPIFMQKIGKMFKIQKDSNSNHYLFSLPLDPLSKLEIADINDIGPIFTQIVTNPLKYSGVTVVFAGDELTGDEIAKLISKYSGGKTVKYNYVPTTEFSKLHFQGASQIAKMFDYFNKFGIFYSYDRSIAKGITKLTTFDEYLKKNPIQIN
ncbi:hypothetical protein DICPUDRAFT_34656 [Dictyostelium purpureum]|uniref:NmrA-like domain-containing protein n=1 Tax=Dictyostelium purpureum TaxID=5786 RepID=F0ZN34_DICPU|nr:uncharacterized protein DICPUDRAFT_34656 [Dictyostelium purpureum]EGC34653.1 hypothetical protein DICPUDRAFT_34656 [Dictyostelium purpureum]|eukprot:XP_003288834.1 hypothetical protein DICPUDRAFT_34656 [Dictyostelium purpureum]